MQSAEGSEGFIKREESCGSVILLSPGRTATDTISHTVVRSANMNYCHNQKEYFKEHYMSPNETNLAECIASNRKTGRGGTYIHVKPQHITKGPRNSTVSKRNWLLKHHRINISPELFFSLSKKVGFSLVVIGYRDNLLARTISSFELSISEHHYESLGAERLGKSVSKVKIDEIPEIVQRASLSFDSHLIKRWELETHTFNEASKAAVDAGFRVLQLSFKDIVENVCGSASRIAKLAECPMPFECIELDGHTKTSHRKRSLADRIGKIFADRVEALLHGTPYEWMLDLSATEWPPGVVPPVPLFVAPPILEDPHYEIQKLANPPVDNSPESPPQAQTTNDIPKNGHDEINNDSPPLKPVAERLKILKSLITKGLLTQAEFDAVKTMAETLSA